MKWFAKDVIFVSMKQTGRTLSCILLISCLWGPAKGQMEDLAPKVNYDTSYIGVYGDELTTRLYLTRKQNSLILSENLFSPWVRFKTNDNLLLGAGYTYSFLTINIGVKLPFINHDNDIYGKSRYLDIQPHFMFRSFIVDMYFQWNDGYYLSHPENVYDAWDPDDPHMPLRGDMRTHNMGINLQYLFNSSEYSYKASFWQNEYQRKSAGSPILGAVAFWMYGMTDSLMLDDDIIHTGFLDDHPFNQIETFNAGPNGGYAYTFVWDEKLYLSLYSVFGITLSHKRVHYSPDSYTLSRGMTVGLTNTTKVSLGFNTQEYYFGLSYNLLWMNTLDGKYTDWYGYEASYFRINFVKRFELKKPIRALRPDLWILRRYGYE